MVWTDKQFFPIFIFCDALIITQILFIQNSNLTFTS